MRRTNLAIAFVLLSALSAAAARAQEPAGRVQLLGGRVSFVPPNGFKPMSKEDIAFKYGRLGEAGAPQYAYSNERQNVSVAVGLRGNGGLRPEQLDELKKFLEADFARGIPGLEWVEREIVTLNGTRWIHLYAKAPAVDTNVVNDIYATIFDGRLLLFNFNSTVAQYEAHKESLRRSVQTITVK
ncbi:MAG TPA: hypothetical protein VGV38_11090 [Pyrinomonadaceae bacterium]|nr:hypothetical protein [Pyrinomonadaceae bacterium]